ncbi:hypothetical protein SBF1_1410018 [Candidatus Desulfosporosinus infrequens]|uniref:Uncharacterized protein n=1 Tax=Candidatus Desulfosporosinus infrequens TaxID=2043169 RepID=A0A2U3K560_9FIRM|nr:hypothetical protein SBF1_1410018 [Candidatus Desulfosporosinus infrequens]
MGIKYSVFGNIRAVNSFLRNIIAEKWIEIGPNEIWLQLGHIL